MSCLRCANDKCSLRCPELHWWCWSDSERLSWHNVALEWVKSKKLAHGHIISSCNKTPQSRTVKGRLSDTSFWLVFALKSLVKNRQNRQNLKSHLWAVNFTERPRGRRVITVPPSSTPCLSLYSYLCTIYNAHICNLYMCIILYTVHRYILFHQHCLVYCNCAIFCLKNNALYCVNMNSFWLEECCMAFKGFALKCVVLHWIVLHWIVALGFIVFGGLDGLKCVELLHWIVIQFVLYLVELMGGPRDHQGQISSNPLNAPESWHRPHSTILKLFLTRLRLYM